MLQLNVLFWYNYSLFTFRLNFRSSVYTVGPVLLDKHLQTPSLLEVKMLFRSEAAYKDNVIQHP